jgi:peptidoglycan/xylan/chitin deacetylase (PgdA/CDA1 family)
VPVLREEGLAAVAQNYDSIEFDENGRLVIRFDTDQIVDEEGEPLSIVIALDEVDEQLLSELGRRIREQIESPSESLNLPSEPPADPTTVAPPSPPASAEVDCDAVPCIALTYDDGPAQHTARLLDILAERDARVTFYTVGSNADYQPDLIARIAAEGHEIGNHTYDHLDLTTLSTDGVHEQVDSTQAAIAAGTDAPSVTLRPPYGATNEVVSGAVGMPQVIWTIDTEDWQDRDAAIVTSRVLEGAEPGVIVLMHDIHSTTVDAAPAIVDGLLEQGYALVTVSELLGSDLVPGDVYTSR